MRKTGQVTLPLHWGVVQRGIDAELRTARRHHWLSEGLKDFVVEPYVLVAADVVH